MNPRKRKKERWLMKLSLFTTKNIVVNCIVIVLGGLCCTTFPQLSTFWWNQGYKFKFPVNDVQNFGCGPKKTSSCSQRVFHCPGNFFPLVTNDACITFRFQISIYSKRWFWSVFQVGKIANEFHKIVTCINAFESNIKLSLHICCSWFRES